MMDQSNTVQPGGPVYVFDGITDNQFAFAAAVHALPDTSSDERPHVLDEACWCEPTVESFG